MSESPGDLPGLDPDQFVGEPPRGEDEPGAFTSGDQSAGEPAAAQSDEEDAT